jgi:hypothetical protein
VPLGNDQPFPGTHDRVVEPLFQDFAGWQLGEVFRHSDSALFDLEQLEVLFRRK